MKDATSKRLEAKRLYECGGMKLVEIAKALNVKASTVRTWKSKDKANGKEWINPLSPRNQDRGIAQSQNTDKRGLYASYLSPKARAVYSAVSDTDNKLELLEDLINVKFSNLITAQQSIDYSDPKQSQADSIANKTISGMIRDYYSIKSGIDGSNLENDLNKVDILIAEINKEAFKSE